MATTAENALDALLGYLVEENIDKACEAAFKLAGALAAGDRCPTVHCNDICYSFDHVRT